MTYEQKLSAILNKLHEASKQITEINDKTSNDNKKYLNTCKGAIFDATESLEKLENNLTRNEAMITV